MVDPEGKARADRLWPLVCPSCLSNDDPWINPVGEGAPSLVKLECRRVLIFAAEKDILRIEEGFTFKFWVGVGGWVWLRSMKQVRWSIAFISGTLMVRRQKKEREEWLISSTETCLLPFHSSTQ
ncbi:hypothetical protein RD792_001038 [Penstemon davidsonii]|uniref:Uncharacterized protein n=1 Tax=Penstemon davidsonii TaxID=160366 RepID=A0ABR0DMB9_9LAMI|nr:hypothetical protein RD792_001038 [Penstemon davidsonii]